MKNSLHGHLTTQYNPTCITQHQYIPLKSMYFDPYGTSIIEIARSQLLNLHVMLPPGSVASVKKGFSLYIYTLNTFYVAVEAQLSGPQAIDQKVDSSNPITTVVPLRSYTLRSDPTRYKNERNSRYYTHVYVCLMTSSAHVLLFFFTYFKKPCTFKYTTL